MVSQHKPLWDAVRAVVPAGFRKTTPSWTYRPGEGQQGVPPERPWQCLAVHGWDVGLNRLPEGPDGLRTLQGPTAPPLSPYQCSGRAYKASQRRPYWLDSRTWECPSRALSGWLSLSGQPPRSHSWPPSGDASWPDWRTGSASHLKWGVNWLS